MPLIRSHNRARAREVNQKLFLDNFIEVRSPAPQPRVHIQKATALRRLPPHHGKKLPGKMQLSRIGRRRRCITTRLLYWPVTHTVFGLNDTKLQASHLYRFAHFWATAPKRCGASLDFPPPPTKAVLQTCMVQYDGNRAEPPKNKRGIIWASSGRVIEKPASGLFFSARLPT